MAFDVRSTSGMYLQDIDGRADAVCKASRKARMNGLSATTVCVPNKLRLYLIVI